MANTEKVPTLLDNGKVVKVSMVALYTALLAVDDKVTVKEALGMDSIQACIVAGKGGFSGITSFIEVALDDTKPTELTRIGRTCAMTGAIYPFNNDDKAQSFFYKNGSYVIGGEILKANSMKAFDDNKQSELAELEEQMLDGAINPREWKDAVTAIKETSFEFHITDERKAELVTAYHGYADKDSFLKAYNSGKLHSFSECADTTEALRAEYVKPEDVEAEDVEAEDTTEA